MQTELRKLLRKTRRKTKSLLTIFLDWLQDVIPDWVFPIRFIRMAKYSGYMNVDGRRYLYFIVPPPEELRHMKLGGYNGYVHIPFPSFKGTRYETDGNYSLSDGKKLNLGAHSDEYHGILTYVPVHGGITYSHRTFLNTGVIYGFDTAHHDSHNFPRDNREWIERQIALMIKGIRLAEKLEPEYLAAKTNEEKAAILQKIQDLGDPAQRFNFGVAINLLGGKL